MNRETAEAYVLKSIDSPKALTTKTQFVFLVLNFLFLGISLALCHAVVFIVTVACVAVVYLVALIALLRKKNLFRITVLIAVQLTVFCIAFDFLMFGVYQIADEFVLWEFLASMGIQAVAFVVDFFLAHLYAKKFDPNTPAEKASKATKAASAAAALSCASSMILLRVFSPSESVAITIIVVCLNIMSCLLWFGVWSAVLRAFYIKKYQIEVDIKNITQKI